MWIFSRFWFVFGRAQTLKIELPPRREHDFWKIPVSKKYAKKHWFWLHFGRPKTLIFAFFFDVFGKQISSIILKAKTCVSWTTKTTESSHLGPALRNARLLGREKERGQKPLEQDFFGRSSWLELEEAEFAELDFSIQHALHHLRWGGGALRAILQVNLVLTSGLRTLFPEAEER